MTKNPPGLLLYLLRGENLDVLQGDGRDFVFPTVDSHSRDWFLFRGELVAEAVDGIGRIESFRPSQRQCELPLGSAVPFFVGRKLKAAIFFAEPHQIQ